MTKVANSKEKKVKNESKVWQSICSVKLAVIIITILAVSCIIGTIILQQRTSEEYIAKYGEGLTKFFAAIQVTDIFHSYWFAFLLVLLCVNLCCCTIKRWRNTVLQIGFLITHISIIMTLIGCFIDLQFGEKGGVNVYEGRSVDYYLNRADYRKIPLGFQVYCDDFLIERHPPKYRLVTFVKDKDRQKVLPVKVGKKISIPGSNYAVTVKDYYPDAEYIQEPINISSEPRNPAIYVQLLGSNNITAEGWLLAKDRNWYNDPKGNLKIEYLWADNDEDYEKLAKNAGKSAKPKLDIIIEEKNIYKSIAIEEGKNISIDSTDYKVEIKEFVLDYAKRTTPLKVQTPINPAVRVEITGPQGVDSRWSFSKYPDYWDKAHQTKYKDIKLSCYVPDDFSVTKNKLRIVQSKNGKQTFSYLKDEKVISITDWEIDKRYDIDKTGQQIKILEYFPSYSLRREVVQKTSDNHEGHDHPPGEHVGNPAIFVEIDGPRGKVGNWVLSNNPPKWYPDKNFALLYERAGMAVKDYKSILRVVEDGKTVLTKTIEVNDPLKYKGYVFYQSSYDPEGERYTGLQVTRNPGLIVVYSGFILLCVGVVFIFYVKPFLRRKMKKGQKVESYYTEEEIAAEHID
ncbi:MAG: ResB-like c-type cytochrome synthesis protein [Candidatus Scalindua rubra]|uniref:ResB-like c-type cytochrome synthesis protein n=1 Tax=Candidatus Scalindua rubra TaxID=1872076 RepID=A0A1E3XAI1_9BACT|nr:MAG: ResB-like c-type cytochrome synthesis protein [Candidatus Scalindua rubra]